MSGPQRYRKKPVVIEAMRWTGDNDVALREFASVPGPTGLGGYTLEGGTKHWRIHTLEGVLSLAKGDYLIRGVAGEFYPCKPDIFEATYDSAGPQELGEGPGDN